MLATPIRTRTLFASLLLLLSAVLEMQGQLSPKPILDQLETFSPSITSVESHIKKANEGISHPFLYNNNPSSLVFDSTTNNKPPFPNPKSRVAEFLTPSITYNQKRFWLGVGTASTLYTVASVGLWEAWYKNYPTGKFQTIDDRREWLGMDKIGHAYTGYHYTRWAHKGLRWAGVRQSQAILTGAAVSLLLQSTIEVMDGFSQQWGYSWWDMGMNVSGVGFFVAQEFAFNEQRINVKMSSWRVNHSTTPIPSNIEGGPTSTVAYQAELLYGNNPFERFIKDYNAQTIWIATNPAVLIGKSPKAPWLNLAFGVSANNVYGPFSNSWSVGPNRYSARDLFPRHYEYIFSLDIDLERIPTRNPVLKTVLHLANHFKIPAPALLLAQGQNRGLEWRWLYY